MRGEIIYSCLLYATHDLNENTQDEIRGATPRHKVVNNVWSDGEGVVDHEHLKSICY